MKEKNRIFSTIIISSIGGMLEFYDFVIFILFAKILATVFFPSHNSYFALMETLIFFAIGYFIRPVGGIILAHFGDRYGRKKIFMFTVFLMAFSTLFIGLIPSYNSIGILSPILLLILRIFQGLAVGGEIPGACVFLYEHTPSKYTCLGISSLISGLTLGLILGSLVGMISSSIFTKDLLYSWGWRVPFIIGGVLGFVGVYIRRKLIETPIFLELQKEKEILKIPFLDLVNEYKTGVFKGFCVTLADSVLVTTFSLYLPTYLIQYCAYSFSNAIRLNFIGCVFNFCVTLIFGLLSIKFRINEKKAYLFSTLIILCISFPFFNVLCGNNYNHILAMLLIINFFCAISFSVFFTLILNEFAAGVRFSGVAFSYNIAFAISGGITPLILTFLIHITGNRLSPAYFVIFACVIGIYSLFVRSKVKKKEPLWS